MPFQTADRVQLLSHAIHRAQLGQLDGTALVNAIVAAVGTALDATVFATEAQALISELQASKANSDASSVNAANQITTLQAGLV